jgi:hypothetical protein
MEIDIDYARNCVFIDETAFYIDMKRLFAQSTKGTGATVKVPKTRAKATTILCAISPYGIVNISARRSKAVFTSKKKKEKKNGHKLSNC